MRNATYEHIKENIHLLDIDYENGVIKNRKSQIVKPGYAKIKLKQKMIGLHQIISFLKYGKDNIGLIVNHKDGNKTNNTPRNLELVTYSGNAKHAFDTGLRKPYCPQGEKNVLSKLKNEDVIEIRKLLEKGLLIKDVAKMFNIDRSTISRIKSGHRWKHVN
jgi:hypothetical protein